MDAGELVCLPRLSRVAVCGGTHGNELSGVYLVREMSRRAGRGEKEQEEEEEEEKEEVLLVLGNPLATQQGRRYIKTDLNRCFTHANLSAPLCSDAPYELLRCRELNSLLGPKGSSRAVDLLCDLHNTTANMGLCVITYSDHDWICLHIFKHLQAQMPDIPMRFLHFDVSKKESYSLDTLGKHGFAMEVGPQSHGVVRSNIYMAMKRGVQLMLKWVHDFNSGRVFEGGRVDVYTMVKHIDYPRDPETHNITAAIHPHLQDGDFRLLHPGEPLFQTFSGETLSYRGKERLYPFFINECAYYEKSIALSLARRRTVVLPPIRVQTEQEQQQEEEEQELTSEEEEEEEEEREGGKEEEE